jgi:hypothetical protein
MSSTKKIRRTNLQIFKAPIILAVLSFTLRHNRLVCMGSRGKTQPDLNPVQKIYFTSGVPIQYCASA